LLVAKTVDGKAADALADAKTADGKYVAIPKEAKDDDDKYVAGLAIEANAADNTQSYSHKRERCRDLLR
jgi:hypothetical protein